MKADLEGMQMAEEEAKKQFEEEADLAEEQEIEVGQGLVEPVQQARDELLIVQGTYSSCSGLSPDNLQSPIRIDCGHSEEEEAIVQTNLSPPTKKFSCSNVGYDFSIKNLMAPIQVQSPKKQVEEHEEPKISVQYLENVPKKMVPQL